MIPDQGELEQILDEHLYQFDGVVCGIPKAAEAIAARLTLPHRMSEFVIDVSVSDVGMFFVPDSTGTRLVLMKKFSDRRVSCHCQGGDICADSNEGATCDHVQAVGLYLARQEKINESRT